MRRDATFRGKRFGTKDYTPLDISVVNWMRQFQSANTRALNPTYRRDCLQQTYAAVKRIDPIRHWLSSRYFEIEAVSSFHQRD